ncbi:polyamine-modulated factor 1-binding protein 1-like [Betta splendens]|uniref:Polyamine-modulated factor 1-binding protein 1-like n=1 Tax=Betta splendens TaxID=158456 RepID=A0A8M1H6M2_BETSP|nr:polyamine-modulated factor 1-binding protein 1-like [Betta splendens]
MRLTVSTVLHHVWSEFGLVDLVITVTLIIFTTWKWKREKSELLKTNAHLTEESLQSQRARDDAFAALMVVKDELLNQRRRLQAQLEEVEQEREENKQKLQSVEKEITKQEILFNKPGELLREKENLLRDQWKLDQTKKDTEKQLLSSERLLELIEAIE